MNNYDYPMGADTPDAPWNEVEYPDKDIEVTVSITLSKTVKISVNDYNIETDEDEYGRFSICDYSKCNLYKAVEDQIVLPQNLAKFTERIFDKDLNLKEAGMPKYLKNAIEECKGWNVDEMECILE